MESCQGERRGTSGWDTLRRGDGTSSSIFLSPQDSSKSILLRPSRPKVTGTSRRSSVNPLQPSFSPARNAASAMLLANALCLPTHAACACKISTVYLYFLFVSAGASEQ